MEARLAEDPLRGREILRRILKDGRIALEPQPDGVYLARTEVLPLLLLAEKPNGRPWILPGAAASSGSSGGVLFPYSVTPWLATFGTVLEGPR